MTEWKAMRRYDNLLVEHICSEHGVGHPDFYSAARMYTNSEDYLDDQQTGNVDFDTNVFLVHGCCGCCHREGFPGSKKTNGEIVQRMMDVCQEYLSSGQSHYLDIEADIIDWLGFTNFDLRMNEVMSHGKSS